jgi:RND family efflux transporter MFP subunit
MRFMTRGLLGLFILVLTIGLLLIAGNVFYQAVKEKQAQSQRQRPVRERTYSVEVQTIALQTVTPVIETYGEVVSGRTLEIRAVAGGALVRLAPDFREGGRVKAGDLLFQTDPASAEAALKLLQTELAEAEAELDEASEALILARDEQTAAERQAALRQQALDRQKSLKERGVGTDAAIESAELALSGAEQAILGKRQAVADAKARINRAAAQLSRTRINVDEAARKLRDTAVYAEFDGVLSDVSAVLGGLVNANERVGQLIDPKALEVLFRISNSEFATLTSSPSGMAGADVLVDFNGLAEPVHGKIARVSAAVGEGQTGREIYASLDLEPSASLRPGDFVAVRIEEPELTDVAVIPAAAVTTSGEVLLVGADNRLEAAKVQVLRKQGDSVLVRADGIVGRQLVLKRAPQLGTGIRVDPKGAGGQVIEDEVLVPLSEEKQKQFIAALEQNRGIPPSVRERMLARVRTGEVPAQMAERLDAMLEPGASASSAAGDEMVTLTVEERARLIAAVNGNPDMSEEVKTRMVERLSAPEVSKETYDRINSRIGG